MLLNKTSLGENLFLCLSSFWRNSFCLLTPFHLQSLIAPTSAGSDFSSHPRLGLSCLPPSFLRTPVLHGHRLNNPGQSPHFKILKLITKSLCRVKQSSHRFCGLECGHLWEATFLFFFFKRGGEGER